MYILHTYFYAPRAFLFVITNKFYEDISLAESLSSDIFRFSNIAVIQGENARDTYKVISNGSENINDTETECAPMDDCLKMHISASNETTLVSEIQK